MAAPPDMDVLMASEGSESAPVPSEPAAEDEELSPEQEVYAEDLGFDVKQALALKRFIESCGTGGMY